jgi:hypothetical protein
MKIELVRKSGVITTIEQDCATILVDHKCVYGSLPDPEPTPSLSETIQIGDVVQTSSSKKLVEYVGLSDTEPYDWYFRSSTGEIVSFAEEAVDRMALVRRASKRTLAEILGPGKKLIQKSVGVGARNVYRPEDLEIEDA